MAENEGDKVVTADSPLGVQVVDVPSDNSGGTGDTIASGAVVGVVSSTSDLPTAGELRADGYQIDENIKDDERPTAYAADRLVSADDELAVQIVEPPNHSSGDAPRSGLQVPDVGDTSTPEGPPAQAAVKDEWVTYAVSEGADEAEAKKRTKAQLIEQYGKE